MQCLNKAAVKFAGESPKVRTAVGGIIGNAFAKGDAKWAVAVVECRNEGDVSCGYAANTYNSARGIHVGGLCGFIAGNETVNAVVRFSSNTGAVHSESGRIGGIMALASFCDVQECVNEGTVDGSAAVAGGISGLFEAGDMYGCVNVGDVLLKGSGNAGGIVGTTQTPKRYTAITDCRNGGVICGRFGFTASILAESRNDTDRVDGCGVGGAVGTPSQGREAPRVTAENYGMFILGRNTERNNAEVGEVRPCYYWNGTK